MLPRDFPPRSTVYGYFRAWIVAGVWARMYEVLYRRTRELEGRDESPTAATIDSQSHEAALTADIVALATRYGRYGSASPRCFSTLDGR